jgi:hypothetical protein
MTHERHIMSVQLDKRFGYGTFYYIWYVLSF